MGKSHHRRELRQQNNSHREALQDTSMVLQCTTLLDQKQPLHASTSIECHFWRPRAPGVHHALLLRPTKLPYVQFLRDVRHALAIRCTRNLPVDREPCRHRSVERALEGIYDEATNVWKELRERELEGKRASRLATDLNV